MSGVVFPPFGDLSALRLLLPRCPSAPAASPTAPGARLFIGSGRHRAVIQMETRFRDREPGN